MLERLLCPVSRTRAPPSHLRSRRLRQCPPPTHTLANPPAWLPHRRPALHDAAQLPAVRAGAEPQHGAFGDAHPRRCVWGGVDVRGGS